jgi:hypothetical protein
MDCISNADKYEMNSTIHLLGVKSFCNLPVPEKQSLHQLQE